MKTLRFRSVLCAATGFLCQNLAAVISFTGGTYSENFDSLGGAPWINDTTLPGWYAYVSNPVGGEVSYGVPDANWGPVSSYPGAIHENTLYNNYGKSIGQASSLALLNLGTSDASPSRSLGSLSTNGHDVVFGVALRNDTGAHISSVAVSYFGEQWRVNSTAGDPSMKLDFSYGVFSEFRGSATGSRTLVPEGFHPGYTNPAANLLDFSAFRFGFTVLPLDGTATSNRTLLSADLPVNWAPGEFFVLRWFDDNSLSSDAMLGINDLQVTAIPEPSLLALLPLGAAFAARRRRHL